ncbi:MAG: PilT/PilU family type 4a pilus ATPase [Planctomycetota bacterium]|nr:PilT/PilU family type 4a pilus ATPase [Planctomycetota bacterium]
MDAPASPQPSGPTPEQVLRASQPTMAVNSGAAPAQPAPAPVQELSNEIDKLFAAMPKSGASDLHLKAGSPPLFRINNRIVRAKAPPLTLDHIKQLIAPMMKPRYEKEIEERGAADFAYGVKGVGRFRVNVFHQRGAVSMAARRVETQVPTLEQLNMPPCVKIIPQMEQGLVLVSGITGSGKSTTLAALINIINQTQACHIVTIEDPIEFLYRDEKAFVNQREIGIDVPNFADGLRYVLRQDPDVILIGEMRDAETFETALIASETGHLVFGTVHASSAPQVVGRVLDYFPPERHYQIRQLLYFNLKAVLVQKLLRGARQDVPRVPAVEFMLCNAVVRKMIHEGEDQKLGDVIRSSREDGMQDFNQSLLDLLRRGLITEQNAIEASPNPEQLQMNMKGIVLGTDRGTIVS